MCCFLYDSVELCGFLEILEEFYEQDEICMQVLNVVTDSDLVF